MNTDLKGELSEQIAITKLMKLGFIVSKPINKTKYDLLIDNGKEIIKIQVKTGNVKEDHIKFNTATTCVNTKKVNRRQYTKEEVDYFVVVNIDEEIVYMIKFEECSISGQRLRLTKTRNGQTAKIKFAKDYILK